LAKVFAADDSPTRIFRDVARGILKLDNIELQPYVHEMSRVVKKTLNNTRSATTPPNPAPSPGGSSAPPSGAQTLLAVRRPAARPADDDEAFELPESWYAALAGEQ
jgi:hypothetical protein